MYLQAQANWFLDVGNGIKRKRSNQWSNADWATALELRCVTTSIALEFVRKNIMPMPSYSAICSRFSWNHVTPGWIWSVYEYLLHILPDLPEFKRVGGVLFDEMKVTNQGTLDKKLDMIIGPGSQVSSYIFFDAFVI